jgi:hypothetical protein
MAHGVAVAPRLILLYKTQFKSIDGNGDKHADKIGALKSNGAETKQDSGDQNGKQQDGTKFKQELALQLYPLLSTSSCSSTEYSE